VDRLELLARVLRDRPGITAGELAADLGVSIRSVFRDLDLLRDRGYPVESARGRGGGLRLRANWGLGRVLLSRDEALCSLLALAIAERTGFPMFTAEVGRARRKLADAFPAVERRRLAPLRERILIGAPASAAVRERYAPPDGAPARALQVAFVEERLVTATYVREDGAVSSRLLEPHVLVINWPAWYVMAYDHLRAAPRTFRLDRFSQVRVETQTFRARPREIAAAFLSTPGVRADRV
jgi:predicted DNA-binding transcriptional regulator YafY